MRFTAVTGEWVVQVGEKLYGPYSYATARSVAEDHNAFEQTLGVAYVRVLEPHPRALAV